MGKINIHLTLDPNTIDWIKAFNRRLCAITPSLIVFDAASPCIPHITLASGYLKDNVSLSALFDVVRQFAAHIRQQSVTLSSPYLVPNQGFIFNDVINSNIKQIKTDFTVLMSDYLNDMKSADRVAHVTLGYIEHNKEAVLSFLQDQQENFTVRCDFIEISHSGPKGTCINSLQIYALKDANA